MPNTLLTIIGAVGAGKSTVVDQLEQQGWRVVREPDLAANPHLDGFYTQLAVWHHTWADTPAAKRPPLPIVFDSLQYFLQASLDQVAEVKRLVQAGYQVVWESFPPGQLMFEELHRQAGLLSPQQHRAYLARQGTEMQRVMKLLSPAACMVLMVNDLASLQQRLYTRAQETQRLAQAHPRDRRLHQIARIRQLETSTDPAYWAAQKKYLENLVAKGAITAPDRSWALPVVPIFTDQVDIHHPAQLQSLLDLALARQT